MIRPRLSLAVAILVLTLPWGTIQPVLAQPLQFKAAGTTSIGTVPPHRLHLPMVLTGLAGKAPTTFDLIAQAIARGELSAEQGLIYKVFAQFSDARLPVKYVGAGTGRSGDLIMEDVAIQAATLSASAKQILTPFFVPPNDSRSWYYLQRMGPAAASALPEQADASWVSKSAAGGKIRVFYWSADAGAAAKATAIAAQFDALIWDKLTTLMNKTPIPNVEGATDIYLWNSYIRNNGTVVPFDANTLGIAVGTRCDQSGVVIYLPNSLPVGSPAVEGLIQYATHEFMHAIQFGMTIQSCPSYRWLKEATATWAEDYVYPLANSEHQTAPEYLSRPNARLDSSDHMHDYGAYVLFYFLTHRVDPSASVVRRTWENAATTGNSYQAMDDAVKQAAPAMYDYYWPSYLAALWNKEPFGKFYAPDGLNETVQPVEGSSTSTRIIAAGKEQVTPLPADIPTGGAVYYHLTFPDSSVRSLTILNGLGYKLSTGDASDRTSESTDGDVTYLTEELASSDRKGATVALLLKASGKAALPYPYALTSSLGNIPEASYCLDMQGPMDEIVVILSNADFAKPDRILRAQGLPVTVWANNVPCWKVTGTAKAIDFDNGVTTEAHGTVTFGWPNALPVPNTYQNLPGFFFPEIHLDMLSAQADWSVSGTRSGCTYSGSGSYTAGEAANDHLTILQGLVAGSPTYRGYVGQGGPETDLPDTYNVSCPWGSHTESIGGFGFLNIPLGQFRPQIKVDASGALSGNVKIPNYEGRYQQYEWNLTGVKK